MLRCQQFSVLVNEETLNQDPASLFCKAYGLDKDELVFFEIRKKSLDARKKTKIAYHYKIDFSTTRDESLLATFSDLTQIAPPLKLDPLADLAGRRLKFRHKPVIIGSGPSGIFSALILAQAEQPVVLVERGEPVEKRLKTVGKLKRGVDFDPESNFCFGEGGAGTFSDGKLTCGRNHPLVQFIFEKLVEFGAPASICYDAHPHIGTDYLMRIAKNMRSFLEKNGSTYLFQESFTGFVDGGSDARYKVQLASGKELYTDHLVLAIGHSARDTYQKLLDLGLAMQPKPFAIGARFEHRQEDIDRIQFGSCQLLPAAEYKLTAQVGDRGVWTFCMCPGGHLLPTSAQHGHLAINGMSYHARNSGFANAAVVVNVRREDFYKDHPLDGMRFQEELEKRAFKAGGSNYHAPAQRLVDFLKGKESSGELASTYLPGVAGARMDKLLPDFVVDSLKFALYEYEKKMPGYLKKTALVVGLESKTSSPVCFVRDKNLQSVSHPGLFPAGEGAGFAGGIVSAALDGVRVGQALCFDAAQMNVKESVNTPI